jgi:hypothetical protein
MTSTILETQQNEEEVRDKHHPAACQGTGGKQLIADKLQ